ncbi:hypothetical protein BM525_19745 (plasmid) [Alteromonas mediterranea]|uniref:Uncharacterized protein n=2 Tax=Alteromonas mediterranea TaxID=314275 RepID=A0AAC9NTF7_9ALTE|nr:hypothetical protein BM524_19550 [Alteromonas mediterranea]APD99972.1 hypothetical protein BM525_19745 [Alteromonas mediterranea]
MLSLIPIFYGVETNQMVSTDSDGASLEIHSKKSAYGAQLAILTKLIDSRDLAIKKVADVTRESRIAIMQERMLAFRLPLTCVRIGC